MRFIVPIFLILISVVGFFTLVSPALQDVQTLKAEMSSYDEALDNARELAEERDKLTKQYNSFSPRDLDRLEVLLPNSVNNIRLILEIEDIASPYGMVLRDVKYDTSREEGADSGPAPAGNQTLNLPQEYGIWTLEFSTAGSYQDFLNFLSNLEGNLRLIDISSIKFTSNSAKGSDGASPISEEEYTYGFQIKTYWLKNVFQED